jgi:DNA-binding GntR family transcriptional regulator
VLVRRDSRRRPPGLSVAMRKSPLVARSRSPWADANTAYHWQFFDASDMPRLKSIVWWLWVAVEPYMRLYAMSADALEREAS